MDNVPIVKNVTFVGDYFTMMTTVSLNEVLRNDGESDWDFAVRLAGVLIEEYYGWDVAAVAREIGVEMDEDEKEE